MNLSTLKLVVLGTTSSFVLSATDLTIRLPNSPEIIRKSVTYSCDASGQAIGVPSSCDASGQAIGVPSCPFSVEYVNGGGNSLAVVPIGGNALIFSNVTSGSGARYTAQQYTWWDAKGAATLYSDSLTGKLQTSCRPTKPK